jgi:hypothetical protein
MYRYLNLHITSPAQQAAGGSPMKYGTYMYSHMYTSRYMSCMDVSIYIYVLIRNYLPTNTSIYYRASLTSSKWSLKEKWTRPTATKCASKPCFKKKKTSLASRQPQLQRWVYVYVYVYVYTCIYLYTYIHICMYIYTNMYWYTYSYTMYI